MKALAMCVRQQSVNTSPKNIAREDNSNTLTELSLFSWCFVPLGSYKPLLVKDMQTDLVIALVVDFMVALSE